MCAPSASAVSFKHLATSVSKLLSLNVDVYVLRSEINLVLEKQFFVSIGILISFQTLRNSKT